MSDNPYVQGPVLPRHLCSMIEPHLQHIEREDGPEPEYLCDGVPGRNTLTKAQVLKLKSIRSVGQMVRIPAEEEGASPMGTTDEQYQDEALHKRIEHNMTHHAPTSSEVIERFEALRKFAKLYSHAIVDLCPEGRDRSLALTLAEDSLMRAVAAIARNPDAMVAANMPDLSDSFHDVESVSRCTCPPGPEEDSIIPSVECREHGVFLTTDPVKGAGDGVEDLERRAAEALTPPEVARPLTDVDLPDDAITYTGLAEGEKHDYVAEALGKKETD